MKLKPMSPLSEHEGYAPSPVRHIKPPKYKEPAEIQTIATILLRRNKAYYEKSGGPEAAKCLNLLSISETRALTDKESKKALALIAALKGNK
jgi:hypothetical protein